MKARNYFGVGLGAVVVWLALWGSRQNGPSLTLVYTTEVQGYVEPCG